MKKRVSSIVFFVSFFISSISAQDVPDKINVILFGTFHFGQTGDANKTNFPDLFSQERQTQIESLTSQLALSDIDKVFIEREEKYQGQYDSLYSKFLNNTLTDTLTLRPEEIQIGFRIAKKSGLKKVYCVDVKQNLPYDKINEFEIKYKDKKETPFFSEHTYPFTESSEKLNLRLQSLTDYYVKLNNDYHQKTRLYDYLHYAMAYTDKDDYTGPELTAVWYERNLKIFSTILNSLTSEDKTIFILFGSSHTDILAQFFHSNPHFNVINLKDILTN